MSDEELLVSYRKTGDPDLFAQLVERYRNDLYQYLRRYLGDAEMAEDAFQAAFLQVHLKCDQFEDGRRFRPWLYTIATNQAIDAQRRNRRHRMASLDGAADDNLEVGKLADLLVSGELDPAVEVGREETGRRVREALDGLTEQMRSVVHLVYYQGLKYREAADVLSIPVGTVKSRMHAAVLRLSESWNTTHVEQE